jgi:hypothetical protein
MSGMETLWGHSSIYVPYGIGVPGYVHTSGITTPYINFAPLKVAGTFASLCLQSDGVTPCVGTLAAETRCYKETSLGEIVNSVQTESLPGVATCYTTTAANEVVNTGGYFVDNAQGYNLYVSAPSTGNVYLKIANPSSANGSFSQSTTGFTYRDTGAVTPSGTAPTVDTTLQPVSYQVGTPITFRNNTAGFTSTRLIFTGTAIAGYTVHMSLGCASVVSGGTAVLQLGYQDQSGATQAGTNNQVTVTCTTAGTSTFVGNLDKSIDINGGSAANVTLTVSGGASVGGHVILVQDTQN